MEFYTISPEETETLGGTLATALCSGAVVAFTGDLGAGKTAFVRGMAAALGCEATVTSPTFTIVQEYEGGSLPLFHFDLYRIHDEDDLFDIGWDDYLTRGGICAVEWSERIPNTLESDTIWVDLRRGQQDNHRIITIKGVTLP